jgi:hypothetical protein
MAIRMMSGPVRPVRTTKETKHLIVSTWFLIATFGLFILWLVGFVIYSLIAQ